MSMNGAEFVIGSSDGAVARTPRLSPAYRFIEMFLLLSWAAVILLPLLVVHSHSRLQLNWPIWLGLFGASVVIIGVTLRAIGSRPFLSECFQFLGLAVWLLVWPHLFSLAWFAEHETIVSDSNLSYDHVNRVEPSKFPLGLEEVRGFGEERSEWK